MSDRIKCPVCRCEISGDGRVIFRQSKEFIALENLRRQIPELRKKIEALERASDYREAVRSESGAGTT
jgi:hypothetical protein